jgi:hypothetical protein
MFFRTLDFNWIVKVWILRFSGSLDLRGSKDFRILGFGHLVFVDLVVLVCWYKDVKGGGQSETFSTKAIFCPTKVINARRTVFGIYIYLTFG